jgi:glycerophosphoryl diester phosphodiesterase
MLKNIGHRGHTNNKMYMDNSLQSFIHANKCELDGVELDIYMTSDFIPFVLHESGNVEGFAKLFNKKN